MVSVFQPATCSSTVPTVYMPNKTAAFQGPYLEKDFNISANFSPLFEQARLPFCTNHGGCSPIEDVPILIFSPGFTIPRSCYNYLVPSLASEGFMVISIDSPYDANIITYPDGHTVEAVTGTDNAQTFLYHEGLRALDASFLIDQLLNTTAIGGLLPHRGPRPFSTDRIAMLGHSLGDAASITAASQDPRIWGAIDWDGSIFLPEVETGISNSVMLISHDELADDSWNTTWPLFTDQKLWVRLANSTHESFSDVATLLDASGVGTSPFGGVIGTIAPDRLVEVVTRYSTAWMNGVFTGKEGGSLLEGKESSKYPGVSTLRENL